MPTKYSIYELAEERILVLDGGLGTMVQTYGLTEQDYRGERFADWHTPLKGCNDILVLTRPQVLSQIHTAYLTAGADIISTDSFNANAVSMADYGLQEYVYEINRAAAAVARKAADEFTLRNPKRPRLVAGSMGPTNRTCSMSADVNDPAARAITFDELKDTYAVQAEGLLDGGADILLIETVFDTLNAKAALMAVDEICEKRSARVPIMVSGTLADVSGRTLSGQTVEAFYYSVAHADLFSIGLNCAFGAKQLRPYLERLAAVAQCRVSAHPNAGLPNVMGGYDETPQMFADDVEAYMREGLVNVVGGCCGTTPMHIAGLSSLVRNYSPRPLPSRRHATVLSGLEVLEITPEANFINIGERTNVAGSAKFARLIRQGDYTEAVDIARGQVEAGAQIIDVCMDDGMIDGVKAMTTFLNMAASEPEIARVPVMIDSSKWEVLEAGLKCTQGKSIVNSISLKEGEQEFLRRARLIRRYGAAAVVMLFDENGQADTFERKIQVAQRAYTLLTEDGFAAEDIIFDPNVLAIATGIESHDNYGRDFIEACRWIKGNLPGAKVSGGVSNLSFSFRGNNPVREAMHSVFLFHAIKAGMDMGIVNPAMLQIYSDIEPTLLELCEDAVLNRRSDATERLASYAEKLKAQNQNGDAQPAHTDAWRELGLEERIRHAMLKGLDQYIAQDALEAYEKLQSPLAVIDTMLMPAMGQVGELFGAGKMFLPQVVKSARVMKRAVEALTPYIESGSTAGAKSAGKVIMATVKGDVHDIGKNIVSVVTACNGYEIKDLGVMVDCSTIADEAERWGADAIGLSGLITPSLDEMIKVVKELERRGMKTDVIIGGATTSQLHTAVKIAPNYSGAVVHSRDASENTRILANLLGPQRQQYIEELKRNQAAQRELYLQQQAQRTLRPLSEARLRDYRKKADDIVRPLHTGKVVFNNFSIGEVEKYIDWNFFFTSWEIKGRYPDIFSSPEKGQQARKLFDDAQALLSVIKSKGSLTLNGTVGIFPAYRKGDDIIAETPHGPAELPMLRSQSGQSDANPCLADYVVAREVGQDYIGMFAVSAGLGLKEIGDSYKKQGDDYSAIMCKLLADRLTEAFAEAVHEFVRRRMWGYQSEDMSPEDILRERYQGRRFAFGYPATPDHSLKKTVFDTLGVTQTTGMRLTENYMIDPGEALCGLMLADPNVKYFTIGPVDAQQMEDYASRRGLPVETIEKLICKI